MYIYNRLCATPCNARRATYRYGGMDARKRAITMYACTPRACIYYGCEERPARVNSPSRTPDTRAMSFSNLMR
eukprot:2423272-Pyramimonas_sp.AAC.1